MLERYLEVRVGVCRALEVETCRVLPAEMSARCQVRVGLSGVGGGVEVAGASHSWGAQLRPGS